MFWGQLLQSVSSALSWRVTIDAFSYFWVDKAAVLRVYCLSRDVMQEISENEVLVYHHVVEESCRDLSIHLGCLSRFFWISVLDGPLSSTHLLEHENGKQSHCKVEHFIDHDCHEEPVEFNWFLKVRVQNFLLKYFYIYISIRPKSESQLL